MVDESSSTRRSTATSTKLLKDTPMGPRSKVRRISSDSYLWGAPREAAPVSGERVRKGRGGGSLIWELRRMQYSLLSENSLRIAVKQSGTDRPKTSKESGGALF